VGILHIHGGAHITCNRFTGVNALFDIIESVDCVVISLEYRLAPAHPAPAQLEDCYAALVWPVAHASDPEFGFNPEKLVVCGGSAGGTLAVGAALLARAHANPAIKISGVLLFYPWLDDSSNSLSYDQYGDMPPWTKQDNTDACDYVLCKDRAGTALYTVPARAQAEYLVGFPSTYIDVGEADVLRDINVKFATTLWAAGTTAELHVWPGAWHGFEVLSQGLRSAGELGRQGWSGCRSW
jgi:acetyl esterase/lipase